MFGLGVPELIIILIIGLVLFGPGKLPDVGKALGKSIREFKSATTEPEKNEEKMVNVTEQPKELSEKNDKG
ncbi:MAG: twin-arginine translocase TatA/TatE family subunit [Selenomonas ruminantium]|nr:twin-arginine translocase TatA/TatE family subunit [Selenomonas ruminantium]